MGDWVGSCRGGDNEGAGLWGGLELVGSKLRGREDGGAGRSAVGGVWGEVAGCFRVDRGWVGVRAGYV